MGEGWIESKPCHGAAKMFILEWDLPIINSCLQLFYASITSVLALLVSSKLVAIVQILEWDLPVINSCLQLCYASITSVLDLLVSSKLVAIVQLLLDENQKIIAHGFHSFNQKSKGLFHKKTKGKKYF